MFLLGRKTLRVLPNMVVSNKAVLIDFSNVEPPKSASAPSGIILKFIWTGTADRPRPTG